MAWQRRPSSGFDVATTGRGRRGSDPEKDASRIPHSFEDDVAEEEEEESPSSFSSRATSSSYSPMLTKAFSRRPKAQYMQRLPNSLMRWLCFALLSTLIIFIITLVRLSWVSDKQIEIEIEKQEKAPLPPPPWESFPFLERYYGGVRALVSRSTNVPEYPRDIDESSTDNPALNETITKRSLTSSTEFNPYPSYASNDYVTKHGKKVDCFLDLEGKVRIPSTRLYVGVPNGFPDPVMGSNSLLGVQDDVCFDRFGRLGPYGLGYSLKRGGSGAQLEGDREGADDVWLHSPQVDFRGVSWSKAQERCVAANKHRFAELPSPRIDRFRTMPVGSLPNSEGLKELPKVERAQDPTSTSAAKLPRTAVMIRTWWDYQYTPEDLIYLRSIMSELSLASGGEYIVHFLVQVKDDNAPIWSDDETYERILRDSLPEEFRGMGILWSERQMGLVYGGLEETFMRDLPVHGVYRSTFMPMQYFAYQHLEYDYFWNWEMDVRYTGHWYHLFDSVTKWAKQQPRKGLWERNGRFYIPSEHGSWEDFRQMVRVNTEQGTNSPNNMWSGLKAGGVKSPGEIRSGDKPVWGPERPEDDDVAFDTDPVPRTSHEKDKYSWGVGEEADLITFNPLFDPDGTTWLLAEDVTGYNKTRGFPPRRTAIITASRLSRRLLMTMHRETSLKRHTMFSEMWPASCALHHGLKAVYAPHSEYIDRRWPTTYLKNVFNAGRNGASGGARTSVFGDREHNFRGTTWYYNAGFPEVLWNRWLGYKFNNEGGEQFELANEGRMCLPPMLLHPIKRVDLVIEGPRD
jgi:hypothetical protein